MTIEQWSESIVVVELQDDPAFTDDITAILEQVDGESAIDVVLNFSAVTYLNSSNIARLLKLRKKLTAKRRRLVLSAVDTNVWGLFLVTGLDKVFEFTDSVATGLASIQLSPGRAAASD